MDPGLGMDWHCTQWLGGMARFSQAWHGTEHPWTFGLGEAGMVWVPSMWASLKATEDFGLGDCVRVRARGQRTKAKHSKYVSVSEWCEIRPRFAPKDSDWPPVWTVLFYPPPCLHEERVWAHACNF